MDELVDAWYVERSPITALNSPDPDISWMYSGTKEIKKRTDGWVGGRWMDATLICDFMIHTTVQHPCQSHKTLKKCVR